MPGMIELDLAVHPKNRNWRYSIGEHDLQVVCQSQPLDNLPGYTIMRIAATTTADSETEKEALIRDFLKVTVIPEAQIPVKGEEHVIETTKDPPFGPIYNLSETELASLREYVNKGLDRGLQI